MKYSIYDFNQQKCVENDLDMTDILILSYIKNFYPRMNKMIEDDKEYVWFNYGSFINEYPILKIKKTITISTRLLKLQEKGIILKKCVRNEKGTFSYVSLTEKYFELLTDTIENENKNQFDENITPFDENKMGGFYENKRQKDPVTIINQSNISKKENIKEKENINNIKNEDFKNLLEEWLEYKKEIKNSYKSSKSIKVFYNTLLKYSNNDIEKAREIINFSIANGYKGIFEPKQNKKSYNNKPNYAELEKYVL